MPACLASEIVLKDESFTTPVGRLNINDGLISDANITKTIFFSRDEINKLSHIMFEGFFQTFS